MRETLVELAVDYQAGTWSAEAGALVALPAAKAEELIRAGHARRIAHPRLKGCVCITMSISYQGNGLSLAAGERAFLPIAVAKPLIEQSYADETPWSP